MAIKTRLGAQRQNNRMEKIFDEARKIKARNVETLPASHLIRADELGLRAVSYLNVSRRVHFSDGEQREEWLPRDLVGGDGKTLIVWRHLDGSYAIPGWEPWHDGMFGGRYADILNALAWVERARDVRAGRAKDFLGI